MTTETETLRLRAAARLELERRERNRSLARWFEHSAIPRAIPDALKSVHELWDRVRAGEAVRAVLAAPRRSYKTTTCFGGAVREMQLDPGWSYGYGTHNMPTARKQSGEMRRFAELCGLWPSEEVVTKKSKFDDSLSLAHWNVANGSSAEFFGRGNTPTGAGYKLLHIDDPLKDEDEAQNGNTLEHTWQWIVRSALPRVNPGGSFILSHHRWSTEDPIGRFLALIESGFSGLPDDVREVMNERQWIVIVLPAFDLSDLPKKDGEPDLTKLDVRKARMFIDEKWEAQKPGGEKQRWFSRVELAQEIAIDEEAFKARMLQAPPRSGSLLFPQTFPVWTPGVHYDGVPMVFIVDGEEIPIPNTETRPYSLVIGVDSASTESATSDYTAIVLMGYRWEWHHEVDIHLLCCDVIHVWYDRIESTDVVDWVARIAQALPGALIGYEKAGEGRTQLQFLHRDYPDLEIVELSVSKSKRARALRFGNAAKAGRIRTPAKAAWLPEFKRQVCGFTGFGGALKDDIPDAGSHAYNLASIQPTPTRPRSGGDRRIRGRLGAF